MSTNNTKDYPLLNNIDSPADLRKLSKHELPQLVDELREYIIHSVSAIGGHFASNLGSVEITIALHYLFNTPEDKLIWDVGHQAYPHKILTGRRDQIHTIRQHKGLSPFPKREESEYDAFGVGHSSTSISAALGMAIASAQKNKNQQAIAVIGDGALTGGMAYEALNHMGDTQSNVLVVLNDNNMSISPNVGALNRSMTKMLSGDLYNKIREGGKSVLPTPLHEMAKKAEEYVKGIASPAAVFEELGVKYFGPVDGHNIHDLIEVLDNLKHHHGPRLLHIVTQKGKGYAKAEREPVKYHGVGVFKPEEGIISSKKPSAPTYSAIFGRWLCDTAAKESELIAITPAMREGSGMVEFASSYPKQYVDVGIAEQHAVTLAAGMACEGAKPVVAIYSTFLQRAYDQLVHDVAIQNLDVLFALDRAGLVGQDGPTHAGVYDYSFMRCLPNMLIMAPADEQECYEMLNTGYAYKGPASVRYPRGSGTGIAITPTSETLKVGKAQIRQQGKEVAILAFGALVPFCENTAKELGATLVNMRFVKPMDKNCILELAKTHKHIITVEENVLQGGAGSAVNELLAEHAINISNIGLPDHVTQHGTREEMLADVKLDEKGIQEQIQNCLTTKA